MHDVYLDAVCKERSIEQQKRRQHLTLDEAGWALLESRPLDGAIRRWCGSILHRLEGLLALQARRPVNTELRWTYAAQYLRTFPVLPRFTQRGPAGETTSSPSSLVQRQ